MSSPARRVASVAVMVGVALAWGSLASADAPLTPTKFTIPTSGSLPAGITAGSDGNLWFTESGGGKIGRITPAGTITEPAGATGLPGPTVISPGVAGTLWFTESNEVGELTIPAGTASQSPTLPGGDIHRPGGVALDSKGNAWVTIAQSSGLPLIAELDNGRWTPTGGSLALGALPESIVAGPDGNMWFAEVGADKIGRLNPGSTPPSSAVITLFTPPITGALGNVVVGPDGNLWIGSRGTTLNPSAVLRITPAGVITPFDLPSGSTANPDVIAVGPDGDLWLAGGGGLTSLTTAGVFTTYPGILPAGDAISSIHGDPGAADALWLVDQTAGTIYRVPLQPPAPPPPTPPPAPPTTPPPPPALVAALAPVSAVAKTSVTLAATISEPAGSPPATADYSFQYGTSTAYGSSTIAATATVTVSGVSVSAPLAGLTPYTTYHYRLVASDCTTASCQTVTPDQSFTTGSILQPVPNVTVGVTVTAGTILIKLHGHGARALEQLRELQRTDGQGDRADRGGRRQEEQEAEADEEEGLAQDRERGVRQRPRPVLDARALRDGRRPGHPLADRRPLRRDPDQRLGREGHRDRRRAPSHSRGHRRPLLLRAPLSRWASHYTRRACPRHRATCPAAPRSPRRLAQAVRSGRVCSRSAAGGRSSFCATEARCSGSSTSTARPRPR
jgi:streptogramin lyase